MAVSTPSIPHAWMIVVRNIVGDVVVTCDVPGGAAKSIASLKRCIFEQKGFSPFLQRLLVGGKAFEKDDEVIKHTGSVAEVQFVLLPFDDDAGKKLLAMLPRSRCTVAAVETALRDRASPDCVVAETGATPLQLAAELGKFELVRYLCEVGADVDKAKLDGTSPLSIAARRGHADIVGLLLEQSADAQILQHDGAAPLHGAAKAGHSEVVFCLLNCQADARAVRNDGLSALHVASKVGHVEVVKQLMSASVSVNEARADGATALLFAAMGNRLEVAKQLCEAGAGKNAFKNNSGMTPLTAAARRGHSGMVSYLCNNGADVNFAMTDGCTPLISAAVEGHLDVAEVLLASGADAAATLAHAEQGSCPKLHDLLECVVGVSTMSTRHSCNKCQRRGIVTPEVIFRCHECDYDVCIGCAEASDSPDSNVSIGTAATIAAQRGYPELAELIGASAV